MTINIEDLVRPNILALTPYSSAADEGDRENIILLNANENPFGDYNRYPDAGQQALKNRLAALKKIRREQLFLDNGSDNIIDLAFRVFCRPGTDKALTFSPGFGMYDVAAQMNDVTLIKMPLDKDFQPGMQALKTQLNEPCLKLIFVCSPNNPTGNLTKPEHLKYILDNFKGIVVLDEAYIDFCPERSFVQYLNDYPQLIILQTLSKAWGMAGLRIGMAIADKQIVGYFNKIKMPYNISSINQQAALDTLADEAEYQRRLALILSEKKRFSEALAKLKIVQKVFPSDTNFLLVQFADSPKVYQHLLNHGLLVRDCNRQVTNCLRITIGSPEENETLINVLKMINHD